VPFLSIMRDRCPLLDLRSRGIDTVNAVSRGLHFLNDMAGWNAVEPNDSRGAAAIGAER
jgi:hypothetical protein